MLNAYSHNQQLICFLINHMWHDLVLALEYFEYNFLFDHYISFHIVPQEVPSHSMKKVNIKYKLTILKVVVHSTYYRFAQGDAFLFHIYLIC